MKDLDEIINQLNSINNSINKKDTIIFNALKLIKLIKLFIGDNTFNNSDNYNLLYNKYLNDIIKLMDSIENINDDININPVTKLPYLKTREVINPENISAPIQININEPYKKIKLLNKSLGLKSKHVYGISINKIDYYIDKITNDDNENKIYDVNCNLVGSLKGNELKINKTIIKLKTYDESQSQSNNTTRINKYCIYVE